MSELREGEVVLGFDPAEMAADGKVIFIGRVRSAWTSREDCPKNMKAAREAGKPAFVELDPAYRQGLAGLEGYSHVAVLSWLDRARRNLIVQRPRHATETKGVFALRSPVRPNPIGLHVARLVGIDIDRAVLTLEGIDLIDGTPVIDVKPYFASSDAIPDATRPGGG